MKKLATFLVLCLFAISTFAQTKTFTVTPVSGGPSYTVTANTDTKMASIRLNGDYSGEISIPGTVTDRSVLPAVTYTINDLPNHAFLQKSVTKVTLPATIRTIGTETFRECQNLTQVVFNEGLESIGYQAFLNCQKLGNLKLPVSLKVMSDGAFAVCTSIRTVNFSELTNLKEIGNRAFSLQNLKTVDQNTQTLKGDLIFAEGLERIGDGAFYGHQNFGGRLVLPSTLKHFGDNVFNSGPTFPNFTNPLSLPDGLEYIGNFAFTFWPLQDPITLPSKIKHIGLYGFFRSQVFGEQLVLPASLEIIGQRSLYFCSRTSSVVVEKGSKLKAIYDRGLLNPYLNYVDLRNAPITDFTKYTDENGQEVEYALDPFSREKSGNSELNNKSGALNGLSPYTLVYLPLAMANAVIPEHAVNVIQTKADGTRVCNNFVVHDDYTQNWAGYANFSYHEKADGLPADLPYKERGCDYGKAIIENFTAQKASYVRTLNTGVIYSVMLPYDAALPEGVRAYKLQRKLTGGEFYFLSTDDKRLTDISTEDRKKLKAYTPYLIRVIDPAKATFAQETATEVTKAKTLEEIKANNTTEDGYAFVGSVDNIYHNDAKAMYAYTLKNRVWYPIKDNPNLKPGEVNGFVHSFRAFILPPAGKTEAKFAMIIDTNDTTTGIEDIQAEINKQAIDIYTIEGKHMGRNFDILPAGIYVVKGKKFYKF